MKSVLIKQYEGVMAVAHRAHNMLDNKGLPQECWFLHGHNLSYRVEIESPILNEQSNMGISFGNIKSIIDNTIVKKWDHALLVCKDDKILMDFVKALQDELEEKLAQSTEGDSNKHPKLRVIIFNKPTSIETLTEAFWTSVQGALDSEFGFYVVKLHKVELFETPRSGYSLFNY